MIKPPESINIPLPDFDSPADSRTPSKPKSDSVLSHAGSSHAGSSTDANPRTRGALPNIGSSPTPASPEDEDTPEETSEESELMQPWVTTVIIRNIPTRCTQDILLTYWPPDGSYDFLFFPYSVKQRRPSKYVFINFTSQEAKVAFYSRWNRQFLSEKTEKPLDIGVARIQGLEANIRYHKDAGITRRKLQPIILRGSSMVSHRPSEGANSAQEDPGASGRRPFEQEPSAIPSPPAVTGSRGMAMDATTPVTEAGTPESFLLRFSL